MRFTRLFSPLLFASGAALATLYLRGKHRRESFDWFEKVVVITGGSRGLGLCLAREVAARGATVALLARDAPELRRAEEDLLQRGAGDVFCQECDVRDQSGHLPGSPAYKIGQLWRTMS